MYSTRPGLILAFHGCDKSVADKVISGHEQFRFSKNSYDWLGHGGYFWDSSPSRALEFAEYIKSSGEKSSQGAILNPAVMGAVLNLGFWEGNELYPNAGFRKKNHIQICIRNPNCIKGYFLPRKINSGFNSI